MRSASILLLLFAFALPLEAQILPRQRVGAGAGRAFGLQDGEIPVYPGSADCGVFSSATVGSLWFGGLAIFPDLIVENFGLSVGAHWYSSSALYTTQPNETLVIFDSEVDTANTIAIGREYRYTATQTTMALDLQLRFDASNALAFTAGIWVGLRSEIAVAQVERSLDSRYIFGGTSRDTVMTPGLAPTSRAFGYGLQVAATYELPISSRFSLQPVLGIRIDPWSQIVESSWRRISLSAGAHILYALAQSVPPPPDPPVIVQPLTPPPEAPPPVAAKKLTASLDLRAVDAAEAELPFATVTIYETHVHRRLPIPTVVDFAANSAALPERYRTIAPEDATSALVATLATGARDTIEAHMLNLLGLRMRENGALKISLTGATGRQEATWLAYARVETVRSYLQRVWGIDPVRVEVRAPIERDQGRRDDPPSVRIDGPEALIGHVDLERVDREFEPPRIRTAPQWEAEAGLRSWSLRFRHGGSVIGEIDSRQGSEATSLNWQIVNSPTGAEPEQISAELAVEDSAGAVMRVFDTIPLRISRLARIVDLRQEDDGSERVIYTLYPESAAERSRLLVKSLISTLPAGARLSIARLGEGGADEAAKLLRAARPLVAARRGATLDRRIVSLDRATVGITAIESTSRTGSTALIVDLPPTRRH